MLYLKSSYNLRRQFLTFSNKIMLLGEESEFCIEYVCFINKTHETAYYHPIILNCFRFL